MNKEVCITIKSTQTADGDSDTTELFTFGHFKKEKDKYTISYDESEATGFEGSKVVVTVTDDIVTMMRTGSALSNLVIEKGKKHHCHYGTPYGEFMVGITADEIRQSLTAKGGELFLKYTVDINSSYMAENEISINVKECQKQ